MVPLGEVLPDQVAERAQVVIEVDQALEVERIVHCGTARVQLDNTVQGGDGLYKLAVFILGVRLFKLRLLSQRGACGPALQLFIEHDGFFESAGAGLVFGFSVNFVRAPAGSRVCRRAGTSGKQTAQN